MCVFFVFFVECASSVLSGGASKDWDAYVEVWELVVKIGEIERTLTRLAVKRSDAVAPFLSWLKEHGAVTGPVELIELPVYGFCVRASEPIKEEELVFSIPEKVMLSVNQSSSIGKTFSRVWMAFFALAQLCDFIPPQAAS